ncbi:hypothetical protein NDU88_006214 [Pleurodeles waltl]|uniref:Uncharacterized protein n=1 Tax=Pleurodeles waltl TaxID=8319 RepID=A0AAV7LNG3_PLEWA|nr:hypothetical protein NDU88_006214 [Pleurodeles waltl]
MHCVDRPLQLTWEVCILGLFPRNMRLKATFHFLDLGLVVAKRIITRKWWSPEPLTFEAWARSFSVWAGAECTALRRDDVLGLHKYPLVAQWELMLGISPLHWRSSQISSDSPVQVMMIGVHSF